MDLFSERMTQVASTEVVQERKALTGDQDTLIQMQTRLVNQLTATLKFYYPVALQLFAKVQQHSTLNLLQTYPTPRWLLR